MPWGGMSGEMRPVRAKVRYCKYESDIANKVFFTFAPNRAHHAGGCLPRASPHSVRLALGYALPGLSARQRDEKRIFPERDKVHSPTASDLGSGALGG